MTMTKQDFQEFATDYGLFMRRQGWTDLEQADATFVSFLSINESLMQRTNPAFRLGTFREWMLDVAAGRRDADGKRVKAVK